MSSSMVLAIVVLIAALGIAYVIGRLIRQATFGPIAAHHHHLRQGRPAPVPHERGPQSR